MPKAKPIPDGFHSVTPHLICKGAAQAIDFYKRAFGAEELMRMPGPDGTVMHAEVKIGDSVVMLGEENLQWGARSPTTLGGSPITIGLYVENADASFDRAVQAGAKAKMPVTDMFWGDRYGQVVDPFGHTWSIATHVKDMTEEEIRRAMESSPHCAPDAKPAMKK